mmetsp:Transcript_108517/g.286225  ORF Transcript_108517/g.286225 Transcript_108517/m.286225 type:complete len:251 (+) Transcript_108517:38-790(+)
MCCSTPAGHNRYELAAPRGFPRYLPSHGGPPTPDTLPCKWRSHLFRRHQISDAHAISSGAGTIVKVHRCCLQHAPIGCHKSFEVPLFALNTASKLHSAKLLKQNKYVAVVPARRRRTHVRDVLLAADRHAPLALGREPVEPGPEGSRPGSIVAVAVWGIWVYRNQRARAKSGIPGDLRLNLQEPVRLLELRQATMDFMLAIGHEQPRQASRDAALGQIGLRILQVASGRRAGPASGGHLHGRCATVYWPM